MLVIMPLFVVVLLRLNRQYEREAAQLEHDVPGRRHRADPAPPRGAGVRRPPRHGLGPGHPVRPHAHPRRAAGRALRRSTRSTADELAEEWARTGLQRVPLELVDCPDRRLTRGAVECVVRELADGETEVSRAAARPQVPRHLAPGPARQDRRRRSSSRSRACPTPTSPSVPFHLDSLDEEQRAALGHRRRARRPQRRGPRRARAGRHRPRRGRRCRRHDRRCRAAIPIADARWRQRVAGGRQGPLGPRRARSTTPPPWS